MGIVDKTINISLLLKSLKQLLSRIFLKLVSIIIINQTIVCIIISIFGQFNLLNASLFFFIVNSDQFCMYELFIECYRKTVCIHFT